MEEIELTTAQKVPVKRIADFENLGFGLFMHYGLYSQIGRGEWGQYFEKVPADEYAKWIKTFNADDFNPREIVAYAKKAGMKYAVLTTRHHEGFSLYDTKGLSDFDVMHSPVKRDLVKEFVDACNEGGIIPFFYHTTLDWHDPRYNSDFPAYLEYLHKSVELLCTNYGKIGGLWFDGNWNNPERDWHADELYAMIRKHQPDAIIANNPGIGFAGTLYGDEEDVICFEQGTPSPVDQSKFKRYMAGEMSQTVNDHWAYWNKDVSYKGPAEIIRTMCGCRAAGANYLLNLTPDGTGKIATIQKGILEVLGQWTSVYGEPFYYGKPVPEIKGYGRDFVLKTPDGKLYLFANDIYENGEEHIRIHQGGSGPRIYGNVKVKIESARWMDNDEKLDFFQDPKTGMFCLHVTHFKDGTCLGIRVAELTPAKD